MATFDFSGMPEILAELRKRSEETEQVAQAMLNAGAAAAVASWRETITEMKLWKSGDMRDSIAPTSKSAGLSYREITAQGKDRRGVRNGAKAFMLHYGTSRIPATYWWDKAAQRAEPLVMAEMRRVWDIYVTTGEIIATGGGGSGKARKSRRSRGDSENQ